jgi:hypothetical protein
MKYSYLVLKWVYDEKEDPHIEVVGVFSSKEKAKKECLTALHFWGELEVDKSSHGEGKPWPTISKG